MAERTTDIEPGARAPGYGRAPGHRVAFIPTSRRVTVTVGDLTLADSTDVVVVEEDGYPPRYYLSRADIDAARIQQTGKTTYCPFKGQATYYVIRTDHGDVHDAAWSYERPFLEGELLRDRVAFDHTRVTERVQEVG